MGRKRGKHNIIGYALPLLPLVASFIFFPSNMWYVAASILMLVPVYSYLEWDSRINLVYGIWFIVIAAMLLGYREILANQILQYGFWFLASGVLCQVISLVKISFLGVKKPD